MSENYKTIISDKKVEAEKLMTSEQFTACDAAIHTASVAAGAIGTIPTPVTDSISDEQIKMAIALGEIFDQKLSETTAKSLIDNVTSTSVGKNATRVIPIVGWIATAAVAVGVTEAIGWSLAVDFAKKRQ